MNLRFILLPILSVLALSVKAQITLGTQDMPKVFEKYVSAYIDDDVIAFDPTVGGASATWDLSAFNSDGRGLDTAEFVSPEEAGYDKEFPNANLIIENDDFTIMANSGEDGIYWLGGAFAFGPVEQETTVEFEGNFKYLGLPLDYEDKNVSSFSFKLSNEMGGGISLETQQNFKRSYHVDGHGSMKMGNGNSYDVLRIKVIEVDSGTTVIKSPLGEETTNDRSYSYYYEFWAKGFGQPLARVEVDSADNSMAIGIELLDLQKTVVGAGERPVSQSLSVFPNPASDRIQIEQGQDVVEVQFFDLTSRTLIDRKSYANGVDVSSLSPGLYLVEAIDSKGSPIGFQKVLIQ